jgi:hypothetical protein
MPPRYATTPPRAFWLDAEYFDTDGKTCTVHEDDNGPQWTGLLDANGTRLYRVRETVRVGFHGWGGNSL